QILYVNGNPSYLALMKDAYVASMKEIADKNGSPERLEHVRRQLRILDPMINLDEIAAAPTKSRGPVVRAVSGDGDPFAQEPLDRANPGDLKVRASAAFAEKRYGEAAALFTQASRAKLQLSAEELQAWSYCRLHE